MCRCLLDAVCCGLVAFRFPLFVFDCVSARVVLLLACGCLFIVVAGYGGLIVGLLALFVCLVSCCLMVGGCLVGSWCFV